MLAVAGTGYGMASLDHFRVRRVSLTLPGLPAELDGLRLAHLSDTHVGRFTHGKVLRDVVDLHPQEDVEP